MTQAWCLGGRVGVAAAMVGALACTPSCRCSSSPSFGRDAGGAIAAPSGSAVAVALRPLPKASGVVHLQGSPPLRGGAPSAEFSGDLWLTAPVGATRPRPLVLVQYDVNADPARFCTALQQVTSNAAFVLCQRVGRSPLDAEIRELKRGVELTKHRFGAYLASGSTVLLVVRKFLRGSERLVRQEPRFFARVLMIGRDVDGWSASTSTLFAQEGGKRVLFASETDKSRERFEQRAKLVRRAGAQAQVVPFDAPINDRTAARFIGRHWAWLVEGDRRFTSEPAP